FVFSFNLSTLTSYPAAVTAVLICAAVISLKIYQTPQPATVAATDRPVLVVPASAEPEWTLASPVATRVFNTRSLRNITESAQTHRSGTPRYVLDSVPVSYETTFKFWISRGFSLAGYICVRGRGRFASRAAITGIFEHAYDQP